MGVRTASTSSLPTPFLLSLRKMLDSAFDGAFDEDDWAHALGGTHVWADGTRGPISHGALVERTIECSGTRLRVGYVEAVATAPGHQRQGHATAVMRSIDELIRTRYPLGVLSTGRQAFYERLGWERWRGATLVAGRCGRLRTPDDDGGIMILKTPMTPDLDLDGEILADWRRGDVW